MERSTRIRVSTSGGTVSGVRSLAFVRAGAGFDLEPRELRGGGRESVRRTAHSCATAGEGTSDAEERGDAPHLQALGDALEREGGGEDPRRGVDSAAARR